MQHKRYLILDDLRGITLVSMILYHAAWDLAYIFGVPMPWYGSIAAHIWQQSICWVFILLSGFCWKLGHHPLKRGLCVFMAGLVISLVTLFLPQNERIFFGVLTLIGSCMLLMIPLHTFFQRVSPTIGLALSAVLFALTYQLDSGSLPAFFYQGFLGAYLGFTPAGFYSADYFPLLPWVFLFFAGYFLQALLQYNEVLDRFSWRGIRPLTLLGKHSLLIYMLHQPILYGVLSLFFAKNA